MPPVGHSASNSGGMGTRGMSANFDDPHNSMPSAVGNRLPPIGDEESEMREKSKKKKKKNRSDNTDFWDVLLGLSRLLDKDIGAVR